MLQNGVLYQLVCGPISSPFVQICAGTPNTQDAPYVNANGTRARTLNGRAIEQDWAAFNGPSVANPLTLSNGGSYAAFAGMVRAESYISQYVEIYAYYLNNTCVAQGFATSIAG